MHYFKQERQLSQTYLASNDAIGFLGQAIVICKQDYHRSHPTMLQDSARTIFC